MREGETVDSPLLGRLHRQQLGMHSKDAGGKRAVVITIGVWLAVLAVESLRRR